MMKIKNVCLTTCFVTALWAISQPCLASAEDVDLTTNQTQSGVVIPDVWEYDLKDDVMTWTFHEDNLEFIIRIEDGICNVDGNILSLDIFNWDDEKNEQSDFVFNWMNENPINKIIFSDNVTKIDTALFSTWLFYTATQVDLGKNIYTIGPHALAQSDIYDLILPTSLHQIGISAFEGCTNLQSVTLPESLNIVEEDAFLGCDALMDVTILSKNVELGVCSIGYSSKYQTYDNFVIRGYHNSTAEDYATENGFTFVALDEPETTEPTTEPMSDSTEPVTESTSESTEETTSTTSGTESNQDTTSATTGTTASGTTASTTTAVSSESSSPKTGESGMAVVILTSITALVGGLVFKKKK